MPRKTFKNVITSQENSEKISKENRELINKFIKDKNRKCSEKTIVGYTSDLEIFFTWNMLYNDNKYYPEIKKLEISDFFSFCISDLKWGGARFSRVRSAISNLSDFIVRYYDEKYPTYRNFIKSTIESLPKTPVREKTVLKKEVVDDLLKHLLECGDIQEACFLSLAINCGARIAELIQFKTTMIDYNCIAYDGMFLETTEQIRTKGKGKEGAKMTKFILKVPFIPYYESWVKERENILSKSENHHNYLFINQNGEPARVQTVNYWLRKWEKYVGTNIYMHSFRHYFVTHLTKIGIASDYIVGVMGWKSAAMYDIYNDLDAKDKKWKDTDILKKYLENDTE